MTAVQTCALPICPVLTGYGQLAELTGLLAACGLPTAHIHQILSGNALKLLARVL